jgi:hypothetical protein
MTDLKNIILDAYWTFLSRLFLKIARLLGRWNIKMHKWSVIFIDKVRIK